MTSAKVTQLDFHRQSGKRHPDGKRLQALSTRFKDVLPPLLDGFFSAADDFLFKMAEKGGVDSSDYFDQLRVLRRRKGEVKHHVLEEVDKWLNSGAQSLALEPQSEDTHDEDAPKFSLMDDTALERTLATDSFSSRTMERAGDHWLAFHERMMALTCQKKLSDKNTPFNAAAVGHIVLTQIERLDAPFKTSLMLFRLFDEMAIPKMLEFYQSSNTWLIQEGILPNLKLLQSQRSGHTPVNAQTIAQLSASLSGVDASNMPNNGSMMPTSGYGQGHPGMGGSGMGNPGNGVLIDAGLLQQMMSSMGQFQAQAAPAAHSLDELKAWTTNQASEVTKQAEGTLEAGTVSLVAMLFEYILDDEKLSAHMKQLLARMQIPIIKVAILDKDFFTETEHSARLLLNRMARSANGWRPDATIEHDVLLDGMENIVTQLNRDFDSDLSIFDRLLDEFTELLKKYQEQKGSQLESIKKDEVVAYEAHQKQDRARLFIDTLLENEDLPEPLETLLSKQWYRLMKGIFNKQGESKAWQTSGRIARELVWTLQPSVQFTQASRFAKVTPKLLDGVAGGLKAVGMSESDIERSIAEIKNYHGLYEQPLNEEIWEAQEKLDQFESQSQKAEVIIDEPAPLPVDEPVVPIKNADLSYYLDQVESMTTDQWFDIEQADGSFERGCLTVIVGGGSKFVFTDYQGNKIAERSAIGLAMSMRNEQFVLIDEDPLFDRMIDNLVDDLGSKIKQ
jgi:hypothetical protein